MRSIPRTGAIERCANTAPTPRPSSSVGPMATANAIPNGRSSAAPRFVMRPTWSTAPPRKFVETSTQVAVVSSGMRSSSPGVGTRSPAVAARSASRARSNGRTGQHDAVASARHEDEKNRRRRRRFIALDEIVERGDAAAFVEGGAFLEARGEDGSVRCARRRKRPTGTAARTTPPRSG